MFNILANIVTFLFCLLVTFDLLLRLNRFMKNYNKAKLQELKDKRTEAKENAQIKKTIFNYQKETAQDVESPEQLLLKRWGI